MSDKKNIGRKILMVASEEIGKFVWELPAEWAELEVKEAAEAEKKGVPPSRITEWREKSDKEVVDLVKLSLLLIYAGRVSGKINRILRNRLHEIRNEVFNEANE